MRARDGDGDGDGERWRFVDVEVDRPQPAGRHRHRPVPLARRRAGEPVARPHPAGLPARPRAHRPALRPPGRPRPRVPAHAVPQLGGPGRRAGRARLAGHRAGAGAVRARRRRRPPRRDGAELVPPRRRRAHGPGPARRRAPRRRRARARPAPRARMRCWPARTAAPLTELLDPADRPDHVIGVLWDGTNANVLYDMVAAGEAPNVARLLAMGTGLAHGALASLPSVTLANHTTILTGAHPGHHGILHNAWYDRTKGEQIVTNSPLTWPWAMQTLSPEVETHPPGRAPRLPRRPHGVGQRALRHRRGRVDVRGAPHRRRPGAAAQGRGPAVRHRALRAAREVVPGVLAHRSHGHGPGARRVGRRPRRPLARRGARCRGSRS